MPSFAAPRPIYRKPGRQYIRKSIMDPDIQAFRRTGSGDCNPNRLQYLRYRNDLSRKLCIPDCTDLHNRNSNLTGNHYRTGDVSFFTAGPDITNVSAITGTATLNAVIPAGYTASWTYYNIYNKEYYNQVTTTNATMSDTATATLPLPSPRKRIMTLILLTVLC